MSGLAGDEARAQRIELELVAAALDRWADAVRHGRDPRLSVTGLRDMANVVRAALGSTS